jgi:hypothetical protein
MYLTNPKSGNLIGDRPVRGAASYLLARFAFFFGFAFLGCGGALRMRRRASSNGIGARSGFDDFAMVLHRDKMRNTGRDTLRPGAVSLAYP